MAKEGELRVWHIPQVPMKAFKVTVKTIEEAKTILNVLADYDDFEFKNKVKPDYSNVQGLEVYKNNEWCDWHNEEDEEILDVMRNQEK